MKFTLKKIAALLFAVSVASLSLGRYFDSQCTHSCLVAASKNIAEKSGGNIHIQYDDDTNSDRGGQGPAIQGPLEINLPAMAHIRKVSFTGTASDVKVNRADKFAVRAFVYRTAKYWQVAGSGDELTLNFQKKGPERIEIDLPSDFQGVLNLTTISGSVDIREGFVFDDLKIQSTSGDVATESQAKGNLSINTVSGDVVVRKASELGPKDVELQAVSGDFQLELGTGFTRFRSKTVSGDISLRLIGSKPAFEYRMHSISGDFKGIPGSVLNKGIAKRKITGKVGDPTNSRLDFESISGDFQMTL